MRWPLAPRKRNEFRRADSRKESLMKIRRYFIASALVLLPSGLLHAQLLEKKILTLEAADKVAAAAEAEAKHRNATVVIVVVKVRSAN
jgi:hypothetical protein